MDLEARVDTVIDDAISRNSIVGAVTIVARDGEIMYRKARGAFDREASKPMMPEAIFRIASVTKPLVAATALAMVDRNLLGLDNAVADHIDWFRPKLADGTEPRITIRQLLTHTSGITYEFRDVPGLTDGLQQTDMTLEQQFSLYSKKKALAFAPGTAWTYGMGLDVIGAVIEQLTGGRLHDAVLKYAAKPLGMTDTGFRLTDPARLAVAYADGEPGGSGAHRMADPETLPRQDGAGIETFSPERIFNGRAWQSGGIGGVSTADDLFKFFEAIRNRGVPILKPETVAQAIQNQVGDLPRGVAGQRFGFLGGVWDDPAASNSPFSKGTVSWGGLYGHSWFIDFAKGVTVVALTNTAMEGCLGAYPGAIARAVYDV
jgi:CubicO group peptidase (beta-lactamase class C family)